MKYIFFLLAIATIVTGIPLEETRNLTLEETQNLSLSRRSVFCPDPHYPVLINAFCRTRNIIAYNCESDVFPGTYSINDVQCHPSRTCVDFIRPDNSEPYAVCMSNANKEEWNSDGTGGTLCTDAGAFKVDKKVLSFGMTTYDRNSNPVQVKSMDAYVGNSDIVLRPSYNQNHYSKIYTNYEAGQPIKFCFAVGSSAFVTAVAGILIWS